MSYFPTAQIGGAFAISSSLIPAPGDWEKSLTAAENYAKGMDSIRKVTPIDPEYFNRYEVDSLDHQQIAISIIQSCTQILILTRTLISPEQQLLFLKFIQRANKINSLFIKVTSKWIRAQPTGPDSTFQWFRISLPVDDSQRLLIPLDWESNLISSKAYMLAVNRLRSQGHFIYSDEHENQSLGSQQHATAIIDQCIQTLTQVSLPENVKQSLLAYIARANEANKLCLDFTRAIITNQ